MAFNNNSKTALIIVPMLLAIMFAACTTKPAPKPWSKEYISNFRDSLDTAFKAMSDKNQRNQIVGCIIEKVKQAIPKGFESVPRDSSYRLVLKYASDCTNGLKGTKGSFAWTKDNENHLRKTVLRRLTDTAVCDCYITKLKTKYPNGVPFSLSDSIKHTLTEECYKELKKSN
ncbi:hypothetical protein [Mucilaginibacter ginsenosidivorans]|uniref:Lipoprotein n=1 Tax=Mucilaginibacter ginsenosidivorans TaxID=398053 RepID=A0A5B8UUZ3_9SPHI|nr:hypothetical protein [Mucilaginibacter ginsenosidivorans]QEC62719.1 hypothetical protein FRZ54_09015 [Mucilaginibacter ginsenosidivorans]